MSGGIESTPAGIVATGDGIKAYDVMSMRAALRLEIRTGMVMKSGSSIVNALIRRGYIPAGIRSKRKAYAALDEYAVSLGIPSAPLEREA